MTQSYFPPIGFHTPPFGNFPDHNTAAQSLPAHTPSSNESSRPSVTPEQHQTKAHRERANMMRQMQNHARHIPTGGTSSLFAPTSITCNVGDEPHQDLPRRPVQGQETGCASDSSVSSHPFAGVDAGRTQNLAAPRISKRATEIEAFALTDHSNNPALTEPQMQFDGNRRRFSLATHLAQDPQYEQLAKLKRQAWSHLLEVESNSGLRNELTELGMHDETLQNQFHSLSIRCEEKMDAIAMRYAQSRIPVADNPTAAWVAQKMMHSPASRDEFNQYLHETRPLELQIKRNRLAQLSEEMARIPSIPIAPEQNGRREELSTKMDALYAEIGQLEQVVGNDLIAHHETATEMTLDVVARYRAAKYEPLRGYLHTMRNDVEQIVHHKQASPDELRQLRTFSRQLHDAIDSAKSIEYGRTLLAIEDAHTKGHTPHIEYSPEAAISLESCIVFYRGMSTRPTSPDFPYPLRQQRNDAQEKYNQAYELYQKQWNVQKTTGATIHPMVIANIEAAQSGLKEASETYEAHKAQYHKDHAQWKLDDATATKNHALQTLAESVQRTILDNKISAFMIQGYSALADAPSPKPQAGQIGKLYEIYQDEQQSLMARPGQQNTAMIEELQAKIAFLARA